MELHVFHRQLVGWLGSVLPTSLGNATSTTDPIVSSSQEHNNYPNQADVDSSCLSNYYSRWTHGRKKSQRFSCQLCVQPTSRQSTCQDLVTTGTKIWGIGAALPIAKLYDFAVYIDKHQTQNSHLATQYKSQLKEAPQRSKAFYRHLRSSSDIDYSLVVRASRNLPIQLVAAEYKRIFKSRLKSLGHSADDAGLSAMLEAFQEKRLPASVKQGRSVLKGTTLTFTKHGQGILTAHADNQLIASVKSEPLCAAIIDVYLGPDSPVSRKARRTAGDNIVRMLRGDDFSLPQSVPACSLDKYICRS